MKRKIKEYFQKKTEESSSSDQDDTTDTGSESSDDENTDNNEEDTLNFEAEMSSDPDPTSAPSTSTKISETPVSSSTATKDTEKIIKHIYKKGLHYIRCEACFKNPNIVKVFAPKGRIPSIASESGTRFRAEMQNEHAEQPYNTEALKVMRRNSISTSKRVLTSPIRMAVSKANELLAKKIGGLLVHVYNDANHLTLTPHSFPSRMVAEILSINFDMESNLKVVSTNELQYLNPTAYRDLLNCIVESDKDSFCEKLINSSAVSLRCDGSVDRTQIDKIFVIAKIIEDGCVENLFFLGVDECLRRGAEGLLLAVQSACTNTIGKDAFEKVLQKASSFVMDGTNCNTGEKGPR